VPHAAPHRCCFCLKACSKTLSSKDAGPASLPSCPLLLAWVPASMFHWSRFGTASLKAAELDRSTHWEADTMNPKNVPFLLLRTLRAPSVCYVSFWHSFKVVSCAGWMAVLVENTSVTCTELCPHTKKKRGNTYGGGVQSQGSRSFYE